MRSQKKPDCALISFPWRWAPSIASGTGETGGDGNATRRAENGGLPREAILPFEQAQ
jgi:hypothetical protein